jgi:ribosomal protein S18 acetylase RimI-like enzyme
MIKGTQSDRTLIVTILRVFHLWYIGIHSDAQRKGIGTKLMDDIKKESQVQSRPIYLETS